MKDWLALAYILEELLTGYSKGIILFSLNPLLIKWTSILKVSPLVTLIKFDSLIVWYLA